MCKLLYFDADLIMSFVQTSMAMMTDAHFVSEMMEGFVCGHNGHVESVSSLSGCYEERERSERVLFVCLSSAIFQLYDDGRKQ